MKPRRGECKVLFLRRSNTPEWTQPWATQMMEGWVRTAERTTAPRTEKAQGDLAHLYINTWGCQEGRGRLCPVKGQAKVTALPALQRYPAGLAVTHSVHSKDSCSTHTIYLLTHPRLQHFDTLEGKCSSVSAIIAVLQKGKTTVFPWSSERSETALSSTMSKDSTELLVLVNDQLPSWPWLLESRR